MMIALLPILVICLFVPALRQKPFVISSSVAGKILPTTKRALAVRVIILPLIVGLAYGLMQRLAAVVYTAFSTKLSIVTILSFFVPKKFLKEK